MVSRVAAPRRGAREQIRLFNRSCGCVVIACSHSGAVRRPRCCVRWRPRLRICGRLCSCFGAASPKHEEQGCHRQEHDDSGGGNAANCCPAQARAGDWVAYLCFL